ncbi:hypothetical protein EU244_026530 [Rhodococcus qingshengii]|uniref:hypothetical protein n=1 Tax=Rhodococcus qingshengii TaxID=334542 RepID=UPI0010A6A4C7|nr:hypothetical protein [Rhodococcus qingshengii]THJ69143.1 hypothetical protein EU244_22655 [Rhodococcus qingshengii]
MTDTTRSLLDRIDELVDEQLDGGEPETGYDFDDPDFPGCSHCNRDWHGLAITERIERMRLYGTFDVNYKFAEDDSPVLCPGSGFIGPWATPNQVDQMRLRRTRRMTVTLTASWIDRDAWDRAQEAFQAEAAVRHRASLAMVAPGRISHESSQLERYLVAARSGGRRGLLLQHLRESLAALYPGGMWSVPPAPDDPFVPEEWSGVPQFRPRGWTPREWNCAEYEGTWPVIDEPREEPSTRQQRALPRPSSTLPMWAVDVNRSSGRRRNQ